MLKTPASPIFFKNVDSLFTSRVAHCNESLPVVQPLWKAVPDPIENSMLFDGILPEAEGERFPAAVDGERIPVRMNTEVVKELDCIDETPLCLCCGAMPLDLHFALASAGGLKTIDVGSAVIHDAIAVAVCRSREVFFVIGVPPQIYAVRVARVEISNALVVGEKENSVANPHRACEVPIQIRQQRTKLSVAIVVNPQFSSQSSAITFPIRRIGRAASKHLSPLWSETEILDRTPWILVRLPTIAPDSVQDKQTLKRLGGIRCEKNFSFGCESPDTTFRSQVRQAFERTTFGKRNINLAVLLFSRCYGKPLPIRGHGHISHQTEAGSEPASQSARCRNTPDIILGHKVDGFTVNRRTAVVTLGQHSLLVSIRTGARHSIEKSM